VTNNSLPFPALYASHSGIWLADISGSCRRIARGEAVGMAAETPLIVLNAVLTGQRLGYADLSGLDLLELFAFVHPAQFCVPTPAGLFKTLGMAAASSPAPADDMIAPMLREAASHLLSAMDAPNWPERDGAWSSAQALHRHRWSWSSEVLKRLKKPEHAEKWLFSRLTEWEEEPPPAAPRGVVLDDQDIIEHLDLLTGEGAEEREGQQIYARHAGAVFRPREQPGSPNMLLAEAGTGIGKTLGYLAPASLWSAETGGSVWISTYTKALQRQLNKETQRIYPDAHVLKRKVVVRKGRENYLCLLNLEDAMQGGFSGRPAILAQLVARWAAYSRDGDMIGGDLPGWLTTLFRRRGVTSLTDRRGECIYAGCPHYRKCFIEKAVRASQHADIVIANHALVMVNAARGREEQSRTGRIIFDEGHHLFDAADSMFAANLTGQEAIEIRRWVIGPEQSSKGRRRGLSARLSDLASYDEEGGRAIEAARVAANAMVSDGWLQRLNEGSPHGPMEEFFAAIRGLVYARDENTSSGNDAGYSLETELAELPGDFIEAAAKTANALDALLKPLIQLGKRLEAILIDGPDWLDGQARARAEGALNSLQWRMDTVSAWLSMVAGIGGPPPPDFISWLGVERFEGREFDIGYYRRWIDPMKPFAEIVLKPAHGVITTSATLKTGDDWGGAMVRSGAVHLERPPQTFAVPSPFDYAAQAEILIVTDIRRGDISGLASAYAGLIQASGGGALGLFTAIKRLRAVHGRIADRLAEEGLPLYAQHVDPIDTGTLVDIFRDEPRASLLGTDALRDGVDVPGHSLRLVVMEGVPWPKPNILHKARRLAMTEKGGGSAYDDAMIRGRLAQAFGRLIRSKNDRGQFVVLSPAFPSRLLSAFPKGTNIRRVTLAECLQSVQYNASLAQQSQDDSQTLLSANLNKDDLGT
jgi:ATP-dependent DNA helicase DinG